VVASRLRKKLFHNRDLATGTHVAVRLNLNSRIEKDEKFYFLQTVHANGSPTAKAVGYDIAVTLTEAYFVVNQTARVSIVNGHAKFPMAAVAGSLSHTDPSLDGVELRFNPKTGHLFVRADDGRAVKSVEEATIFNTRVYARGEIEYWSEIEAPKPKYNLDTDAKFEV
jgi:hypothetical protein